MKIVLNSSRSYCRFLNISNLLCFVGFLIPLRHYSPSPSNLGYDAILIINQWVDIGKYLLSLVQFVTNHTYLHIHYNIPQLENQSHALMLKAILKFLFAFWRVLYVLLFTYHFLTGIQFFNSYKIRFCKSIKGTSDFLLRYSPLTCLNYCFWARQNFSPWHASSSFPFLKSINRRWEELLFWKQRMLLFSAYLYMAADGEEATLKKEE